MDVTSAYVYSKKNLPSMFQEIQNAQVPEKFTNEFLRSLGFKSTNDRAFISVLKGLGFLDPNSVPTATYSAYKDKAKAPEVLGNQIRIAYKGLFLTNENAQGMDVAQVKDKLATITGKDKAVVNFMATTFKTLCSIAEFKKPEEKVEGKVDQEPVDSPALENVTPKPSALSFSHTIYINLPTTRDIAVYDAIFKSIREHLL